MNNEQLILADLWRAWGLPPTAFSVGLSLFSSRLLCSLTPATAKRVVGVLLRTFPHARFLWVAGPEGKVDPEELGLDSRIVTRSLFLPPLPDPLLCKVIRLLDGLVATEGTAANMAAEELVPVALLASEGNGPSGPSVQTVSPGICSYGRFSIPDRCFAFRCQQPECLITWRDTGLLTILATWKERYRGRDRKGRRFPPGAFREPLSWHLEEDEDLWPGLLEDCLRKFGSLPDPPAPPEYPPAYYPYPIPEVPPEQTSPLTELKKSLRLAVRKTGSLWVIYSGASLQASGGGQRPAQMAQELAQTQAVLYLCHYGGRGREGNLFYGFPQDFLPLLTVPYNVRPVGLVTYPDPTGLKVAQALREKKWFLLYDCIDWWPGFKENIGIDPQDEVTLSEWADLVTVSAKALKGWVRWMGAKEVKYLPNAATPQAWPATSEVPADLWRGALTILYSGHITGSWLDMDLLRVLGETSTERGWAVNLIGGPNPASPLPGLHYLGEKPYSSLGSYLRNSDVAIIPFLQNRLTECVSPLKVYDYLAAGVPVVSTPLPELDGMPGVFQASGPEEFIRALEGIMEYQPDLAKRAYFRRENDWQSRMDKLCSWVREAYPNPVVSPVIEAMEDRLREGLFRPDLAQYRMAWYCGTSCGYSCPYCIARLDPQSRQCPYSEEQQLAAWAQWRETYGPAQIIASGQEAMHDPSVRAVLGKLSEENVLDINSNLAFDLEDLVAFSKPEQVYFSASYHPSSGVPILDFLHKIEAIRERGFQVTGASCVLYPPFLSRIAKIRDQVQKKGLYFLAHPFRGTYRDQVYPESYTPTERETVRALIDDNSWEFHLEARDTFGQLCWTGARYGVIDYSGHWKRCPAALPEGNFFEGEIELQEEPRPCPIRTGCHCNDLWRYILREEEVQALLQEGN